MNKCNHIILSTALTMVLALVAALANAQSQQTIKEEILYEKVQRLSDSIDDLNTRKAPRYLGYDVTLSFPQYRIESNISQLNNLSASFSGGAIGGLVASERGKVKANIGLYYSDASMPYSIDLFRTSITSSIYLLRLKNTRYHTLEPYSVVGVSHQMNRFFGHYLDNTTQKNYSVADEPFLGQVSTTQLTFGGGIEFQLENDRHQFMHFFTELTYAKNINTASSNTSFAGTQISDPLLITLGVSFGVVK